jgi:hypothetical protein
MKRTVLFSLFFCGALSAKEIYVSPAGNDAGEGTLAAPLTLQKAVSVAEAGDVIYLRGGAYHCAEQITITRSGREGAPITLAAYPKDAQRPVLDCAHDGEQRVRAGILLQGDYWHLKGWDITHSRSNGLRIHGSHNVVEACYFYENGDTGLQISGGGAHNRILNCDSYWNRDRTEENADGFACKMDAGDANYFEGCRAWQNSDDGYDGYLRGGTGEISSSYHNCWAFYNGYRKDGTSTTDGDGNGFKMGGFDRGNPAKHNQVLTFCVAAANKVNGFDRNSNIGSMTLYHCSAHNNGRWDYAFPAGKGAELAEGKKALVVNSLLVGNKPVEPACHPCEMSHNSWQDNMTATPDRFVKAGDDDWKELLKPRKTNGSLPDIEYLHLKKNSELIDKGMDVGLPYSGVAPDLGAFEYP